MDNIIIKENLDDYHRRIYEIAKLFYSDISFVDDIEDNKDIDFVIVHKTFLNINGNIVRGIDKENVKKKFFIELVKLNNYHPPFGAMTGIRPTRPGFLLYEKTKDINIVKKLYKEKYFLSNNSIKTVIEVIKKEHKLLKDQTCLYVSIPFCPSLCRYCTFAKQLYKKEMADKYIDRLLIEINEKTKDIKDKISIIYIGGGTPSVLDTKLIYKLLRGISNITASEYTFEAGRCDTLDKEKIKLLYEANVSRICINPQTLNDETLKLQKRDHDVKSFYRAFEIAKKYDWNINSDLIFGFENENIADMKKSLDRIIKLKADNITLHPLAIKKDSKINILDKKNTDVKFWENTKKILEENGYNPYYLYRQKSNWNNFENVGFSINNKECVYNMQSIEQKGNIIGAGVGAMSIKNGVKSYNTLDLKKYIFN